MKTPALNGSINQLTDNLLKQPTVKEADDKPVNAPHNPSQNQSENQSPNQLTQIIGSNSVEKHTQKHIVITGATSGIGEALAKDYLKQGHVVYAVGRNTEKLAELANMGMHTQALDVTQREAVLAWFDTFNKIDMVILVAGNCKYIDIPNFDSNVVADMLNTNVASMAHCIQGALPYLIKSQGHLVGVGSASAYVPFVRAEAYGASKASVHYLLDTLKLSLAPYDVSVSKVVPGFVETPLTAKNNFSMPFIVDTQSASQTIMAGIAQKKTEIHFPKRLTVPLKLFNHLPDVFWHSASRYLNKN